VRSRAAARALSRLAPAAAAEVIADAVELALGGDVTAVAAIGQALLDPRGSLAYEHVAAIYAAASERGLPEVTALLVAPGPRRAFAEPLDKADPKLAHLTLGQKKALARVHRDPDLLARLAAEGDPTVVRELLRNPLLTESFAVRIAARRPCRPETLRALHAERRWRTRPAVAVAIARNPHVEPELALKILPMLPAPEVAEIAQDATVHAVVRALAVRLLLVRRGLARRPPPGPGDG